MKDSNKRFLIVALIAAGVSTLGGCARSDAQQPAAEEEAGHEAHAHEAPWHFVEGRGVRLSERGKDLLGIELREVDYSPVSDEDRRPSVGEVFATTDGEARATLVLPAEMASTFQVGSSVTAFRDDSAFTGRVESVDRQLASVNGQAEVLVRLRDPESNLLPGQRLALELAGADGGPDETLTVPSSALLQTARGDFVYVRNGDYFFRSAVGVGRRLADRVEIAEGLFEGDLVAAAGSEMLWLTELQSINGGAACADGH